MAQISDKELLLLEKVVEAMEHLEHCVREIESEKAYTRMRDYMNGRFSIGLPYYHPLLVEQGKAKKS